MRISAAIVGALLIAPAAIAQERGYVLTPQAAGEQQVVEMKRAAEVAARVPFETPVKGAPYSADVIVESSQTLVDGNHISNKNVGHVFRDVEGRTRREQEGTLSVVTRTDPVVSTRKTTVSIVDPVAGYSYSLDPEHRIAWRTPLGTTAELLDKVKSEVRAAQRSSQPMTEQQKKELAERAAQAKGEMEKQIATARGGMVGVAYAPTGPLEHGTIDGLPVEGHKSSQTIPAGQIGNEQPITITSEEWRSPDLKVLVLTKHNDPRTGESIYRLANVVRAEPDPSLFVVPSDYEIRDTGIRRNNE